MGAITDVDGKVAINNVPTEAKALIVSYLGMITPVSYTHLDVYKRQGQESHCR